MRASVGIFAVVAVMGCKPPKGVQVDARELIPAEANAAFGFELAPVRASPLGPVLHEAMQGDADMRAMLAAVPECNVDLANLRGIFATVVDSEERFVTVIESPKIGDEDNVRCIEKGFAKATGEKDGLLLFQTRGDVRMLPQQGGGYVVILNENAIAAVDQSWEKHLFAAIEDPSTRNTTSPLVKAIGAIDPSSDAWLAMMLSDADRAGIPEVAGADGIATVTAALDLASGMKVALGFDTRDAANAKQLEQSIRTLLDEMKPALPEIGMPAGLLDNVKVGSAEARVTATVELAPDAVPAVLKAMGPLMAE